VQEKHAIKLVPVYPPRPVTRNKPGATRRRGQISNTAGSSTRSRKSRGRNTLVVIKEVLNGAVHVRFEAQMAEPWDLEEVLRNHESLWEKDSKKAFSHEDLEVPNGEREAAQDAYLERVD
jgi:hypothetical protein